MTQSVLIIEAPEATYLAQPGVNAHIGRHPESEIYLDHPTVSRIHAWIRWTHGDDYPKISDYQSTAGLEVDRQAVKFKHLHDRHEIRLGEARLVAQLYEDLAHVPSYADLVELPTHTKVVTTQIKKVSYYDNFEGYQPKATMRFKKPRVKLQASKTATLQGGFTNCADIHRFLVKLEREETTGTLTLTSDLKGVLCYVNGRIVGAHCGKAEGKAALQQMLLFPNVRYELTGIVDADETNPSELNLSVSSFIRKLSKDRPSQRFKKIFKKSD